MNYTGSGGSGHELIVNELSQHLPISNWGKCKKPSAYEATVPTT
jgi:hypothetical protein